MPAEMKTILADGQCHYAIFVGVAPQQGQRVVEALRAMQPEVRRSGFGAQLIAEICHEVSRIPGVQKVTDPTNNAHARCVLAWTVT